MLQRFTSAASCWCVPTAMSPGATTACRRMRCVWSTWCAARLIPLRWLERPSTHAVKRHPMQVPSQQELAQSGTLEELYGKLGQIGIAPGWAKSTPSLWPEPRKNFAPAHWTYDQARGALDAAGRLINTELAERRNLILFNPATTNSYGTVRTMVAAYQMIMPGEWARSHRHTPNALRLILDSDAGVYTEVDGVKIAMEPGDVLLTPNWSSHGHGNDSRACAYWLDFLDVPLVQMLEPMFFEPAEEEKTHEAFEGAPPTKDSPFVFTLTDTLKRLDAAAAEPAGP